MTHIDWQRVTPVLVSIGIIIGIAILRNYSKTLAAIVAVMPINVPLGMWIVTAGAEDPKAALQEFSAALLINIVPTLAFLFVAWQMTRAGHGLLPTLVVGYLVWGVGLLIILWLRGS